MTASAKTPVQSHFPALVMLWAVGSYRKKHKDQYSQLLATDFLVRPEAAGHSRFKGVETDNQQLLKRRAEKGKFSHRTRRRLTRWTTPFGPSSKILRLGDITEDFCAGMIGNFRNQLVFNPKAGILSICSKCFCLML